MTRFFRGFALLTVIVVLGVPVTVFATIALMPLWSAVESRYGIESVGHSGPADWCFWLVFAIYLAAAFVVARLLRDRQ